MKIALALALVGMLGCTKHNPASCCTSAIQCAGLGIDQIYACSDSNVCNSGGSCVAPQCSTSADCAPSTPACVDQLCVASCSTDLDCGATAPACGPGGACVECLDSSQCPANAPVCSTGNRCLGGSTSADAGAKTCPHELVMFERGNLFTHGEVIRVNLDDFIEHSYSDGTVADIDGSWSYDGTKVALSRGGSGLWTVDRDGQNLHRVDTQPNAFVTVPEWSPDGTRLSYEVTPFSGDNVHIFVALVSGSTGTDITPTAKSEGPAWRSPDGQSLLFESNRTGDYDVFKVSPDGSNPVNLTNRIHDDISARWSTDGSKIVFTGYTSVSSMNADGSGLTALSPPGYDQPSWGVDGKIYYVRSPTAGAQLYVMNPSGTNQHAFDPDNQLNLHPVPSPDGGKLAWDSRRDASTHSEIYVADVDGTHVTRVTNSASASSSAPKWRPCP